MSPAVAIPNFAPRLHFQFRIRSILFCTLAVAVCGACFQTDAVFGSILSVPIMVALVRTMCLYSPASGMTRTFLSSLALLFGLVASLTLNVALAACAIFSWLLLMVSKLSEQVSCFLRDHAPGRPRILVTGLRVAAALSRYWRILAGPLQTKSARMMWSITGVSQRLTNRFTG